MLALFQADKRTVFAGSRPAGGLMLFQCLIFGVARRFVEQSSYRSESPLPGVSSTDDMPLIDFDFGQREFRFSLFGNQSCSFFGDSVTDFLASGVFPRAGHSEALG
jgi:hypothetical protein